MTSFSDIWMQRMYIWHLETSFSKLFSNEHTKDFKGFWFKFKCTSPEVSVGLVWCCNHWGVAPGSGFGGKGLEVAHRPTLLHPSWPSCQLRQLSKKELFSLLAAAFPWACKEAEVEESWGRSDSGRGRGVTQRVLRQPRQGILMMQSVSRQAQSCSAQVGEGQCVSLSSWLKALFFLKLIWVIGAARGDWGWSVFEWQWHHSAQRLSSGCSMFLQPTVWAWWKG